MSSDNEKSGLLGDGLKVAAELLVSPGSSLLLKQDFKRGLLHVGAGALARVALGPPGVLLTAANSFSLAQTGENLFSRLSGRGDDDNDPRNVSLRKKVYAEADGGVSLDVITESVVEDVEDLYHEATVSKTAANTEEVVKPKTTAKKSPRKAKSSTAKTAKSTEGADK